MTDERHLHDQRHRARDRLPAPPLARRLLRHDKGKTHASGKLLYSAASFRTAARGSTSSSTPRTSSTSASTGAGSSTPRCCCGARHDGRGPAQLLLRPETIRIDGNKATKRFAPEHLIGQRCSRDVRHPEAGNVIVLRKGGSSRAPRSGRWSEAGIEQIPIALEEVLGAACAACADRHRGRTNRRGPARVQRGDHRASSLEQLREPRHRRGRGALPRPAHRARRCATPSSQDKIVTPRGGDHRDLPAPAPGRSADDRDRDHLLQQPVLQPRALRPLARRPAEAQPQAGLRPRGAGHEAWHGGLGAARRCRSTSSPRCAARTSCEVVRYLIELKNGNGHGSTTSTTSATGASARSASWSRTSTASASSAWSAPSRSA